MALLPFVHLMPPMNTDIHLPRAMVLMLALAVLVGCGGGDSSSSGGGTTTTPPVAILPVTAYDVTQNTARLADLNLFRSQSDPTPVPDMTSHDALIKSAVRHAGWQAIDNAGLNHNEPRSNALFTADYFVNRIKAGNGGSDIVGALYSEDIASNAGSPAITLLWNSVYHRLPMMRHQSTKIGYGDKDMARADYPSAGVSAGNGFATLDFAIFSTPAVTLAYWPGNGTTNVPKTFNSDSEWPDPVPLRNQVGCPIHMILPQTTGTFSQVNITLVTGSTDIPLMVLAGVSSGFGAPFGAAGDVVTLASDSSLRPGELFIIPKPPAADYNAVGLAANTSYTYNATVTFNSVTYTIVNVTYTTGP
jgi:hypothetical protein